VLAQTNPALLHPQFTSSHALMKVKRRTAARCCRWPIPKAPPLIQPILRDMRHFRCVRDVLKAFFKEDAVLPMPVEPSSTGSSLQAYNGSLTIGEELNKLGSNISLGRDWAGVHYRSDGTEGMFLGEEVGVAILKDWRDAHPSSPKLTLTKFNGEESKYKRVVM